MATPYTSSSNQASWQSTMSSNMFAAGRYASAPRMGGSTATTDMAGDSYQASRSMTPNRYGMSYTRQTQDGTSNLDSEPRTPSSTGLIRLSLKKPMGIVFEPMYDPNQPSVQRGVRICDLPRTGAAALSRKLQVGDELLQINDQTVSRMTFDEIMDFIIEADPESVNLLFRRPRKETLQARQGVQQKLNAAANKDKSSTVQWVDGEKGKERKINAGRQNKGKRSKKGSVSEEDSTLQSSTVEEESLRKDRGKKKSKVKRGPYETESFLDLLIDTICSNSNNVCRDFRKQDEDYSEDEESIDSQIDEETCTTVDESIEQRKGQKKHVTPDQDPPKARRRKSQRKEDHVERAHDRKRFEDDGTLATMETEDRLKEVVPVVQPPLGLAPNPIPPTPIADPVPVVPSDTDDDGNPAPIKEVEYDEHIDHGADVSVMESLGGPSLLIEKQRAAAQSVAQKATTQTLPADIIESFGLDYPASYGKTREQTIEADPLKFYTFVVRGLLEKNEPEKVRLLDKLLAKYKGREDHLVQKLSVRYNRPPEETASHVDENDEVAFTDAVKKSKASSSAAAAVSIAKDRLQSTAAELVLEGTGAEWPEKEHKEADPADEEESESGSEYSGDQVDGTSPAVIAQVSELLNYVYGKTSVPGQIDRVSTIMRAYEGREAVLLELLETKALIKANKEKENADNLPSFLRNSQLSQAHKNAEELGSSDLPPVTPMATQPQGGTVIHDDISSMSGVSSPVPEPDRANEIREEIEVEHTPIKEKKDPTPMKEVPKSNAPVSKPASKPQIEPEKDRKKKKGIFGGLFGGKKKTKETGSGGITPGSRASRSRR